MSKPHGTCVFCGSTENEMSKQHILPDRLKSLVPRVRNATLMRTERMIYGPEGNVAFRLPHRKIKDGHVGTIKARIVCVPCNGGWIKDGETEAFEVLEPLILGNGHPDLDLSTQLTVARMASTIFCMVDLHGEKSNSAIPQLDRTYVWENHAPPPHWQIFLGRCDASDWETRIYRHTAISLPKGQKPRTGQGPNSTSITVTLGKCVLHLIADQSGPILNDPIDFSRRFGVAPIPISGTIKTGAMPTLNERTMQALADDFVSWNN